MIIPTHVFYFFFHTCLLIWLTVKSRSPSVLTPTSVSHLLAWEVVFVVVVQLLSCVWLFVTPWTAACQAPLSFTVSRSLLRFMSLSQWCYLTISSSMSPCSFCLQSFPASGSFPVSQLFASGGQSIEASASASALPVNTQVWFPLGLTILISFQSTGPSRVFSSTILWCSAFFMAQLSHIFFTLADVLLPVSLSTIYWQTLKNPPGRKEFEWGCFSQIILNGDNKLQEKWISVSLWPNLYPR